MTPHAPRARALALARRPITLGAMSLFLPQRRPHFEAALRDVSAEAPRARVAAAESLGEAKEDDRARAREALATLTVDAEPEVRFAALAGLGKVGDASSFEAVLPRLDDEAPFVREVAVIVAAQLGDPRAPARVRRALSDAHPAVRFQALVSLAELEGDEARVALFPALGDDDAHVRANAAAALATLSPDAATADRLAKLLADPSAEVRLEAALALAKYGDRRAARELGRHLDDDRAFDAIEALAALGATERADDLARIARSFLKPLALKAAAAAALAKMRDPRGIAVLRDIARAFRSDGRTYVAETIGMLGLDELAPELAALAERPRGVDVAVLVEAIGKLLPRHPELRGALERIAARGGAPAERARELLAG